MTEHDRARARPDRRCLLQEVQQLSADLVVEGFARRSSGIDGRGRGAVI